MRVRMMSIMIVVVWGVIAVAVVACNAPAFSAAQPPVNLKGTNWTLVSIMNKPAVPNSGVTLAFGDEGRASGSAGCNRYSGNYTVNGDKLTFGPMISTKMFCAQPGVMEQEAQFTTTLEKAASFKLNGDRLEMIAANGDVVIVLAKA